MKLQPGMFKQMRAASRALMGKGPMAATAVLQKVLQQSVAAANAHSQAPAPTMRDINPPPPHAAPAPDVPEKKAATPMFDHSKMFDNLVPDMLANLDRMNEAGRSAFTMPNFQMPGGAFNAAPAEVLPGTFTDGAFSNAAGSRHYKLYVPSTYTGAAVPLVVMLHGCTQDPDDFARGTQMNVLAEEMGCLVLYPAQSQQANSSRCWNWFSAKDQTRDQGEPSIIAGMTREIDTNVCSHIGQNDVAFVSDHTAWGDAREGDGDGIVSGFGQLVFIFNCVHVELCSSGRDGGKFLVGLAEKHGDIPYTSVPIGVTCEKEFFGCILILL